MTPEQNRQTALAFYDLMFNQCRPREAVEPDQAGRIVEHWDVLQVVPAEAQHSNTMF